MHYLKQFLRVEHPGAAWLEGPSSGFFMRLQIGDWPEWPSSTWWCSKVARLHGWWVNVGYRLQASAPHPMGLFWRLLECPTHKSSKREQEGLHNAFYNLVSQITCHRFCHILFISSKSLSPVHSQRVCFAFWKEECQRICGYILNPAHHMVFFLGFG